MPGVVTVITREEIVASGARDLIDVLYRVSGFACGLRPDQGRLTRRATPARRCKLGEFRPADRHRRYATLY